MDARGSTGWRKEALSKQNLFAKGTVRLFAFLRQRRIALIRQEEGIFVFLAVAIDSTI